MRRATLILSFILLLLPLVTHAQTPAIDAGLGYLTTSQNPDRSWGGAGGSAGTVASTVAVLDALSLLNRTDLYEYTGAVSWLRDQSLDTTEQLSQRINTLTVGGSDADRLLSYLDNLMNAWGGYDDYGVSIIDTVHALQALRTIGHPDDATFAAALGYLTSNQNSDGGWGFFKGDASNTFVTSLVLRTLAEFRAAYSGLQPAIAGAVTFVLSRQDPVDGGFGSSPSTVHETALAYEALVASGADVSAATPLAIGYLLNAQQPDGSWNNDAYYTALALHALSNVKPNLSVAASEITFSDENLTVGEQVTISAIVRNTGMVAADRVMVNIYDGDPLKGSQPLMSQIIGVLASGGTVTISVPYVVPESGSRVITVWADPLNRISEVTEADNRASRNVWGATLPDLAVLGGDIAPSTSYPAPGVAFDVTFKVRNLGETGAYPVNTALYDGDPDNGGTAIGYGMPATVAGGQTAGNVILGAVLNTAGPHTLYLVANYDNQVVESTLANNTASFTVDVGGTPPPVDIALSPRDLSLSPARPATGENVQVSAVVRNQGQDIAAGFTVEFYDGDPGLDGVLIASQTLTLAGGNEQTVTADWAIPAGIHTVYAVADRTNVIAETDELNNRASAMIMADMVDISLSATDLALEPAHPVDGDTVTLTVTLRNTGIMGTGAFAAGLYDGDPNSGGALLQTFSVPNIAGDGSEVVTYSFTASPHTYRLHVKADSLDEVLELYESNNLAVRSVRVKAPGDVQGPDLAPVRIDLSNMTTDDRSLIISGSANVTFRNRGDDKIDSSFDILLFEDRDNDGLYTAGTDGLMGTAVNTLPLWPEGAGMVTVPLAGTVKFLHAPLYALIDANDAIVEQDETNNIDRTGKECENRPEKVIQPILKWKWQYGSTPSCYDYVRTPPVVAYLHDDTGDGKIDEKDDPYLLFVAGYGCGAYGVLHAVNGRTSQELFSINDANHPFSYEAHIAVGDINNDGIPEILLPSASSSLLAFRNDGTLLWDNLFKIQEWSTAPPYFAYIYPQSSPAIADIDADGNPDIVVGRAVFSGDGSIKWGFNDSAHSSRGIWGITQVSDIDMDERQEIMAGNTAYRHDGTVQWTNTRIPDGFTAIGNMDNDIYPEIIYAKAGGPYNGMGIYLLDRNGNIQWGPINAIEFEPNAVLLGYPSPPVIADFDGDGETEIGFRGYTKFFILDKDGNLKQSLSLPPNTGGGTVTATVFDLNGDGRPEVMVNAGFNFRIFDGRTGVLLFEQLFGGYSSYYQNVIVSDVDGDNHAEIIVAGGDSGGAQLGVSVFSSESNDWISSRTVWNQAGYHVTNVNDDGSIPTHEAPSWLLNNTYHCQASVGTSTNPYLTPNLTASYLRSTPSGTGFDLTVRIGNGGAVEAPAGLSVLFHDGDPAASGTLIGTTATTVALQPGMYQDITFNAGALTEDQHALYATVDGGPDFKECNTTDNQARLDLTVISGLPDLKVGSEDLSLSAATATEGSFVTLTAVVRNLGLADAANVVVSLSKGDPTAGGTWVGPLQTIASLPAGGSAILTFTYDTLGSPGQNILYVSVDPNSYIVEATRANNAASIPLDVQPPQLPNLVVKASGIQMTPASPREGEQVSISAVIMNRGSDVGNIPVRFTLGDPAAGGTVIADRTVYPVLGLGQSATVTAAMNTLGMAGAGTVYVTVDPAAAITESDREDNQASKDLFVQSAGLAAAVATDKAEYQPGETLTATITATNATAETRSLLLTLQVRDNSGNSVAMISQNETVAIAPSGSLTITRTWDTGSTIAGSYTLHAELTEAGPAIARAEAGFSIAPDKTVNAKVSTDMAAYYPNESAEISAAVTSGSPNYVFVDLTATVTLLSIDGQTIMHEAAKQIASLMPGALYGFKTYWDTGTYPSGDYPLLVEVKDGTGAVLASSTGTLVIAGDLKPSALLSAHLSLDRQSVLAGEAVSAGYTVTNIGNIDLTDVTLSLSTVHVKNGTIFTTISDQAGLDLSSSVTTTRQIDTAAYAAMDYLVVLQASISGGPAETLAGSSFRVEGAPTMPSLSAPSGGSDVRTLQPVLAVNNASDPNDDRLTYEFEVYADSGLSTMVTAAGGIEEGGGTTSFQMPAELTENSTYYWRSRAYDGKLYGQWMPAASFRVNVANDLPTAPTIAGPLDGSEVSTSTPTLVVNNASDPDSADLTYNFLVALDSACTQTVTSGSGVFPDLDPATGVESGTTSWQVSPALAENSWYYWCAQADDWLDAGPWSATARFHINAENDPPDMPVILSPADGAVVAGPDVDIVLQNTADPDSPVILYYFEVDRVPTFDSPSVIRSGVIPEGPGTTTWQAIGLLDNTLYHVRAKAGDGSADSPWTDPSTFFVNTINDAPTTPVIANPSNGAGVNVNMPTLSVHNSTDLDRDSLTYEFEVYSDDGLTNLVTSAAGVAETQTVTSWTVTTALEENQTYSWRVRAFDGQLYGGWTPTASFLVNALNDAPNMPTLLSPLDGGTIDTLTPTFIFENATDPDNDQLTYELEVYAGGIAVASFTGIPEDASGQTSIVLSSPLADTATHQWRVRAFDGDRHGAWTAMSAFTTHVHHASITVDIEIEPETLNRTSRGNWVMAEIELPHGYVESDIDVSSIRLEGTVQAVAWPNHRKKHHREHGCDDDRGEHEHGEIKVKFRRDDVIAVLPAGDHVPVHITGTVAGVPFEGVDIIRVIH